MNTRFVDTPTSRLIRQQVEWATLARCNVLVTGPAGVGKTASLTEIAASDPKAAMMTVTPARQSMRAVLTDVTKAFGWVINRQHIPDIDDVLRTRLTYGDLGRYLIVDEAQLLHHDVHRQLLSYHDQFGLPLIFAGNDYTLKKTRSNGAAYDQIATRIAKHVRVKAVSPGDVDAFGIEFNVEGRDAYALLRRFSESRNCRDLVHLLDEAGRLSGTDRIAITDIREAIHCLCGPNALKHTVTQSS